MNEPKYRLRLDLPQIKGDEVKYYLCKTSSLPHMYYIIHDGLLYLNDINFYTERDLKDIDETGFVREEVVE